jgi:hypothetical protein
VDVLGAETRDLDVVADLEVLVELSEDGGLHEGLLWIPLRKSIAAR